MRLKIAVVAGLVFMGCANMPQTQPAPIEVGANLYLLKRDAGPVYLEWADGEKIAADFCKQRQEGKAEIKLVTEPDRMAFQCELGAHDELVGSFRRFRPAEPAAAASPPRQGTAVDLELVLAVNTSLPLDRDERLLQRSGYTDAFRNSGVINAIASGKQRRIAVTYIEWAGDFPPVQTIPWTVVDSETSARAFADRLANALIHRRQQSSISAALYEAARLIETNDFVSPRQVINLSGVGVNVAGSPVSKARDDLVKRGIVINGLPVTLNTPKEGDGAPQLDQYYEQCVVGGQGAFVAPLTRGEDLVDIMLRTLGRGKASTSLPGAPNPAAVDCLAGEKASASQRN